MQKKLLLFASAILFFQVSIAQAQDYKFTALLLLNFFKYVEWPAGSTELTITVLGDDPVIEELKGFAASSKIEEKTVVVKKALSADKIGPSQLIYISPDNSVSLPAVLEKTSSENILVVTNKKGLAREGASINLMQVDGKLRYEINTASMKKSGLSAKPVLFKLGKVFES